MWISIDCHSSEHFIPFLTPICTEFLERLDNNWKRYFFDRVISQFDTCLRKLAVTDNAVLEFRIV